MSDTPRTDEFAWTPKDSDYNIGEVVGYDFARQLERELAAANDRANNAEQAAKQWEQMARDVMPGGKYVRSAAEIEAIKRDMAPADFTGFTTLSELLEDKKRLDWLDEHVGDLDVRIHTTDAIYRYAPIFRELGGACPFRSAIDAARKDTP